MGSECAVAGTPGVGALKEHRASAVKDYHRVVTSREFRHQLLELALEGQRAVIGPMREVQDPGLVTCLCRHLHLALEGASDDVRITAVPG